MQSPTPFARIGTRGSPLALTQAKLVRALLADQSAWEWVSYDSPVAAEPVQYGIPAHA